MNKIIKVPEYFKDLPSDARINSRDMANIFGYKQTVKGVTAITQAYKNKQIPEPDFKVNSKLTGHALLYWKVKTVREWIDNVNK